MTTLQRRRGSADARPRVTRRGLGATAAGSAGLLAAACGGAASQPTAPSVQPATVRYLHFDTGQQVWQDS